MEVGVTTATACTADLHFLAFPRFAETGTVPVDVEPVTTMLAPNCHTLVSWKYLITAGTTGDTATLTSGGSPLLSRLAADAAAVCVIPEIESTSLLQDRLTEAGGNVH